MTRLISHRCHFLLPSPVCASARADATHPAHSQVEQVLSSVGFSDELQRAPVATLSGGWKMKLALGGFLPAGVRDQGGL